MVKWFSRLLAGIFISSYHNISANNSVKTSYYNPYKRMIFQRAQINKGKI